MNSADDNSSNPRLTLLTVSQFKQLLKQGRIDKDDQFQFLRLKKQALCKQIVFGGAVLFYTGLMFNNPFPDFRARLSRILMFCAANMGAYFWFSSPYIALVDKVKHKYIWLWLKAFIW